MDTQIATILEKFEKSDVMDRITAVEMFAHVHGWKGYKGKTIQQHFKEALLKVRKEEREKVCDEIINNSHGGGNWRRVVEQVRDK